MSELHPLVGEEMELLVDVRERLAAAPAVDDRNEDELREELERLKHEMRGAKTEDKPAIEQQYEHVGRLLETLLRGKPDTEIDPASPYFAHLRLLQTGRRSDVFLGRATRLDGGLRIVDWRHAPIARLYYRYQEGDEYEEDMGERPVSGTVLARRTVSVTGGELDRVAAPQGTWVRAGAEWRRFDVPVPRLATGAGAARALEAGARLGTGKVVRADKHLPDIAALIDPEQFELISRPDAGPVVIRGGAGSGKTTVALHRIAWLCYNHPHRFHPAKVLVVVWGRALRDYVSKVLPNLGVQGVAVVTWGDWSRKLVERHLPWLPNHDNANTPSVVSRFKLHPALPLELERAVRERPAPPKAASVLEDWRLLCSDRSLCARLGFNEKETDIIVNWAASQQRQLALREEREPGAEPWLDEEDDAILLRAWQLRAGDFRAKGGGVVRYAHVAVDEVQDFSPMEVAVLLGVCDTRKCITLAGDTQQHIQERHGSEDWAGLLDALGVSSRSVSSLRVSYRSTRTITTFARELLGSLVEDDAPLATREGDPVGLHGFPDHGAAVDLLGRAIAELTRAEPLASIAVIAPDHSTARLYHAGFERMELDRLRLVEDQVFAFAPGVDVVDIGQVKGLEFDYVVVVDASARAWPASPHRRRQLHVAATRAIHQLWVTWVGDPSPLLAGSLR